MRLTLQLVLLRAVSAKRVKQSVTPNGSWKRCVQFTVFTISSSKRIFIVQSDLIFIGIQMAIGHHIGERGHVLERRRNTQTNDREEHNYFEHVGDTDESHREFDAEWVQRTRDLNNRWDPVNEGPRALPEATSGRPPAASSSYSRAGAAAGAGVAPRHRESLSRGFGEGFGASAFPSYAPSGTNGSVEQRAKAAALEHNSASRE